MPDDQEMVTISREEYDSLQHSARVLRLLEDGGVDNWEWYGESLKPLYDEEELDEK